LTLTSHLTFSPDGQTIATYIDSQVILWNWQLSRQIRPFNTHFSVDLGSPVFAFSPDGQTLVTSDYQQQGVQVWR
ncbi:MAG: hypothetical protein VKJ46_04195, partial [Leptolyngbyaceae bacterium]|nr:hypothetical protein [Leptolyngbyaceae bacterium]